MEGAKLLLADPSPVFCEALADRLGSGYELRECYDGQEALALLENFQPDVLVTDLIMPGMDGLEVLKAAVDARKRPAILVTTRYSSQYIEAAIGDMPVDFVTMKPCNLAVLVERIQELTQTELEPEQRPDPGNEAYDVLLSLGIPVNRKGFRCLQDALELVRQDPQQSMTKVLYPEVGRRRGCGADAVERAIRSVIQTAWENRDDALWCRYFLPGRDGYLPRPTNSVFIHTLALWLSQQESGCRIA